MLKSTRIDLPCKINLFLEVLNKREDGFHNLWSLFDIVNFGDSLTISLVEEPGYFRCNLPIPHQDNLLFKAFTSFIARTGFEQGLVLEVEKRVAYGSGLGAASAQVAYFLDFLNRQLEVPLGKAELVELGGSLGSDVPVFFSDQPQFATGRGTELLPMALPHLEYLIMIPQWQGNTKKLFSSPILQRPQVPSSQARMLKTTDSIEERMALLESCGNDFEALYEQTMPQFAELKAIIAEALLPLGELDIGPRLSGSGSSLFIADRRKKALDEAFSLLTRQTNISTLLSLHRARSLAS